jgi:iron(III) transport system permease protein
MSAARLVLLAVLLAAPVVALGTSAVMDQGPGGSSRATVFHLALTAWDPFVWDCARQSILAATLVAAGSWPIGVGLARVVGRWRFWGRRVLEVPAWVPLVCPLIVAALGIDELLRRFGPRTEAFEAWRAWMAWIGAGLVVGVPRVALATRAALVHIDPAWEDAARQSGASRGRTWRGLVWPLVRPDTSRAIASVFALMLLEPGAPLVLGLRRTLAYQAVDAALSPDRAPRAAALALLGLTIAALARLLLRWWGRPVGEVPQHAPPARALIAPAPRAGGLLLILGALLLAALTPLAGLALAAGGSDEAPLAVFRDLASDTQVSGWVVRSMAVALAAIALGWLLAPAVAEVLGDGRAPLIRRILLGLASWMPPLIVAIGWAMIPGLLAAMSGAGSSGPSALRSAAALLDPGRDPGLLLVLALAAIHLPTLARAWTLGRSRSVPILRDAARTLGASAIRARRTALGIWLGGPPGAALVLTLALSASSVGPALILAPSPDGRTIGPAILRLADAPDEGRRRASALALAMVTVNGAALAFASRRRAGLVGDWFR